MTGEPGSNGAASHGHATPAAGPTYNALADVARVVVRKAAEIETAGHSAPIGNEWQSVFATARLALKPPPAESAMIASFGMCMLAGRSALLAAQRTDARARAQTLAATVVELFASRQAGAAAALSSLVVGVSGDESLPPLLPFYVCLEALVRCRLANDVGAKGHSSARAYWRLALAEAHAASHPRLVLCAGLSGSGKSFVANGVAAVYGARVIASDAERKRLAGLQPWQATPKELNNRVYSGRMTERVYRKLAEEAQAELEAGRPVVLDATYLTRQRRARVLEPLAGLGAPAAIVWCHLHEAQARDRLRLRAGEQWSISDADARIRALQRNGMEAPRLSELGAALIRVDGGAPPALLFERLLPRLRRALAER